MAPERDIKALCILNLHRNNATLEGICERIDADADAIMRVLWYPREAPTGYFAVGGGVAYVQESEKIDRPNGVQCMPDSLGDDEYRWQDWADMVIIILPKGSTAAYMEPKAVSAKVFGERLALYCKPKAPIRWKLENFHGNLEAEASRLNRDSEPASPISHITVSGAPRTNVFISYSHEDRRWLDRLRVHLRPLERDGIIDAWDDNRIRPGALWRREISEALNVAKIAVLLVSADFIASDFVTTNELPLLLSAAKAEGSTVLTVIVSPCLLPQELTEFQALNSPDRPLNQVSKSEQERIFVNLARAVQEAVSNVRA
jgi:hypothetical protein